MGSVIRESGEVALSRPIPAHPGNGMLPSSFHVLQSASVRLIAILNCLTQVGVLKLDDLIRRVSAERVIARPAQLPACDRFHVRFLPETLTVTHDKVRRSSSFAAHDCNRRMLLVGPEPSAASVS
jgi:hypothetical protein